ncbi:MAG: hypothetical protein Homavirus19_11, partial [Homavirus sp.]
MKTSIILPLSQLLATLIVSCGFIFTFIGSSIKWFSTYKNVIIR